MLGKAMGGPPKKRRKLKVIEAATRLIEEEQDKRLDQDDVARVALADAEANGIVFLDEIDKIAVSDVRGGSVSREGVQRDLLPLIEGTTVATKYRSEEHTSELQSLMRISYAVFCLKKKKNIIDDIYRSTGTKYR